MRKYLLVLIGIMAITGCTTTGNYPQNVDAVSSAVPEATYYNVMPVAREDLYHEVGPMETLWRIATMYGVDQQQIIQVNHITDPTKLAIGQKLLIPQAASVRSVIPLYDVRPWEYIVIHHTATDTGNATTVNAIHHQRGFWYGLGYHFLIDNGTKGKEIGQIEAGPRWIKQMDGAHCNAAGMNEHGIGIALVGNYSETYVPEKMLSQLVYLVNVLRAHYGIPIENVVGHRDVPGKHTECPGNNFPWNEFIRRLRASQPISG